MAFVAGLVSTSLSKVTTLENISHSAEEKLLKTVTMSRRSTPFWFLNCVSRDFS